MVKLDTLRENVKQTMAGYTGKGLNGYAYLTTNADENLFTVVDIADLRGQHTVSTSLIVRLIGQYFVIEYDDNNKPLVDALLQVGISRHQIVLVYDGEPIPEVVQ